jgi:hypothetical protein
MTSELAYKKSNGSMPNWGAEPLWICIVHAAYDPDLRIFPTMPLSMVSEGSVSFSPRSSPRHNVF